MESPVNIVPLVGVPIAAFVASAMGRVGRRATFSTVPATTSLLPEPPLPSGIMEAPEPAALMPGFLLRDFTFHRPGRFAALFVASGLCLAGCGKAPEIAVYSVPKPDAVWAANHLGDKPRPSVSAEADEGDAEGVVEDRILGAIIPWKNELWFFKLSGPEAKVLADLVPMTDLVKALSFGEDGKPAWKLPEGWSQKPGSEFRYATLVLPSGMEIAVSSLPRQESLDEQLLLNVNRWLGQLQQREWSADQLSEKATKFEAGEQKLPVTFVNLTGRMGGGPPMGGGRGPFAGGGAAGGGAPPAAPKPPAAPAAAGNKLEWTAPPGWKSISPGPFASAAFEVVDGDAKLKVTISPLPTQGNDLLANVNRWRGQVGLPELGAADLPATLTKIPVLGGEANLVRLDGAAPGGGAKTSIHGVIAVDGDRTWFIKLQGPTDLATREQARFEEFAKSLKK
jgi:hypothetical protein